MTGRAYMGEVLKQLWLKSIEVFDKQVNAQKEKNFWSSSKLLQAHKKCAMKMKQRNKQEKGTHKSVIDGRKHFIGHLRQTGEKDWDNCKLRVNDSGHIEGTICLVNRCKGSFLSMGALTGAIKVATAGI